MKTRNGFVSNSSTSSFIAAIKKSDDYTIKVSFEIDLSKSGDILDSHEKLVEHMTEEYVFGDATFEEELASEPYMRKIYDKCCKALEEGKVVIWGCFSSEGDGEEAFLFEKGLRKIVDKNEIDIIRSEGGY